MSGLHSLRGAEPPAGVAADFGAITGLPESVKAAFWEVLEPNLEEVVDDRAEARVVRFCRDREVTPAQLAPAVRACRFLLREAARVPIDAARFAEDLATLEVAEPDRELVLALYQRALPRLRQHLVHRALSAHGKVVTNLDWRVDVVRSSQDGTGMSTPVALFTFRYREGEQAAQITLQLAPDVIEALRKACGQILAE